jgi:hypothetical protein
LVGDSGDIVGYLLLKFSKSRIVRVVIWFSLFTHFRSIIFPVRNKEFNPGIIVFIAAYSGK